MARIQTAMNFKVTPELRARAEACARLIGAALPEFAREAIRDKCEAVEKLQGQRERAARAAAKAGEA